MHVYSCKLHANVINTYSYLDPQLMSSFLYTGVVGVFAKSNRVLKEGGPLSGEQVTIYSQDGVRSSCNSEIMAEGGMGQ